MTDSTTGSTASIWNIDKSARRYIKLTTDNIIPTNGYPTISSDGLTLAVMPTFNFMPGDVICISNDLIDMSVSNKDEALTASKATFLDANGQYIILNSTYSLENRGSNFNLSIKAKSLSLMSKLTLTGA